MYKHFLTNPVETTWLSQVSSWVQTTRHPQTYTTEIVNLIKQEQWRFQLSAFRDGANTTSMWWQNNTEHNKASETQSDRYITQYKPHKTLQTDRYWNPYIFLVYHIIVCRPGCSRGKGPFNNYLSVPREEEVGKISTYSYFGGGEGQTLSYVIFSNSKFYIRNSAVKWFGRDHISFASGR